jgi:SAM-dependent methyltransferase
VAAAGEREAESIACWACGGDARAVDTYAPARLAQCGRCGFLFQPERSFADVRHLYGDEYFQAYPTGEGSGRHEVYTTREESRRYEAKVRVRFVRRFISSGRLLEVGAAAGDFLAEAEGAGFSGLGIEPSDAVARIGRERFGLDIRTGFLEEMELPPRSFDAACAWHVIEHLAEPAAPLAAIRSALAPRGLLFAEVPNVASVRAAVEGTAWGPLDLDHHVGHYTPDSMRGLLERTGFAVVTVFTVSPAVYRRPLRRLVSYGKQALILRGSPFGGHPEKHELLRVVARVAA